jgi:hypothetical protein
MELSARAPSCRKYHSLAKEDIEVVSVECLVAVVVILGIAAPLWGGVSGISGIENFWFSFMQYSGTHLRFLSYFAIQLEIWLLENESFLLAAMVRELLKMDERQDLMPVINLGLE